MNGTVKALETTGTIQSNNQIQLDQPLPHGTHRKVKVIVLFQEADEDDIDEQEWLHALSRNPAFDFLNDPEEDIYTIEDGVPFNDQD